MKKDYSLNSGERQTATNINGIRQDHINRYELAIEIINKTFTNNYMKQGMDVFCGNGYGSWLLANKTGALIDSIDGSLEAIECAKQYYSNPNINYTHKLFPFSIKPNNYDFIVSLESIEHVEDDKLFLIRLYNALKDNGVLIISTPNMEKQDLTFNSNPFHYRHYYNKDFIKYAKNIGFSLNAMFGQDAYIFNNKIMHATLTPEKMDLKKDYNGQFSVFILTKNIKLSI